MPDAEKLDRIVEPFFAVLVRNALESVAQILPYVQVVKEARLLKDIADAALISPHEDFLFIILPNLPSNADITLCPFKSRRASQNRRLAAA